MGGVTTIRSKTVHVVPNSTKADKDTTKTAACGRDVLVRWYEVGPATEVCLACRKAMDWPLVVEWESQWHTFTTDFRKP